MLACRALLENSVMWYSSLSAKPVAFTWFVTLFEVEDLWREALRRQHSGFPGPFFFSFFFPLHCRTSARHCRSTTGMSEDRKQISPKAKANKNKHTTKQRPQNQTRQRSREICKKGETGETSASLSSPSRVLFRQVVLPHVVHV